MFGWYIYGVRSDHVQSRISALADAVRDLESRWRPRKAAAHRVRLPWSAVALDRGVIHELLGDGAFPPLCIATDMARRACGGGGGADGGDGQSDARESAAVLIGRWTWAYRLGLGPGTTAILVDVPDAASRVWAIDLALRSPAVSVVIADGSGLEMSETRRLQLAAEAGASGDVGRTGGCSGVGGALGLMVRPLAELRELSAAAMRWVVRPAVSCGKRPRWNVSVVRCKGVHGVFTDACGAERCAMSRSMMVEWDHAQGIVAVSSDVVDRSGEATGTDGGAAEIGRERLAG